MSRKKSKKPPELRKRIVKIKPSCLIVIATEGQETEPQYFGFIAEWCRTKIRIEILPTFDGLSAPGYVLSRLDGKVKDLRRELQLGEGDQFWLVYDFDTWTQAMFDDVRRRAGQKDFRLAVSNPCFELWLYLHHDSVDLGTTYTKPQLEAMLREKQDSYNHAKLDPDHYCGKIDTAVTNAEALHTDDREYWPQSTGTHVYLLVKQIRELAGNQDFPFRKHLVNTQ